MKLSRTYLFPSPVWRASVPESELYNPVLRARILAERDADPRGVIRSNDSASGAWHSDKGMLDWPEARFLRDAILQLADAVFRNSGFKSGTDAVLSSMWSNVLPRGGYNKSHIHPNSHISGVYYVCAGSSLTMEDPRAGRGSFQALLDDSVGLPPHSLSYVSLKSTEGDIILFPGWLSHRVETHSDDSLRISVSFNINQRITCDD